jgi:hypothetical protein
MDKIENKEEEQKIIICDKIQEYKKRMLIWNNPVEFVNNMYGSHPDDNGDDDRPDYFKKIFKND